MTTSWAHALHGQWRQALAANVGGTLLVGAALIVAPWCLLSAMLGKWLFRRPSDWTLAVVALAVAAVTLADWAVRLSLS